MNRFFKNITNGIAVMLGRTHNVSKRSYESAQSDTMTGKYGESDASADWDIWTSLIRLRAKAVHLYQSNDIGRKFIRMVRKNIPGPYGFTFKYKILKPDGTPDDEANKATKYLFAEWCKPGNCDVTGRFSFRQIQHTGLATAACKGEMLVLKVYDDSKFGFRLQALEPECLDESLNSVAPNGNVIRMGVELDGKRKPVAYWLRKSDPRLNPSGMFNYAMGKSERVPAERVYHYFDQEHVFQTRGITWMAATLKRLKLMGDADKFSLGAMKAGAAQFGVLSDKAGFPEEQFKGTTQDEDENEVVEMNPLTLTDIGKKELQSFTPGYPNNEYPNVQKSMGRRAASGLDVGYHQLFSDFTDVNLSSIRFSEKDVQATWKMYQEDFSEQFIEKVFADFLEMALLKGLLIINKKTASIEDFDRLNKIYPIGRTWDYMDPEVETAANMNELSSGMTSLIRIHGRNGDDTEEIFQEISEVQRLAEKYGVVLNFNPKNTIAKSLDAVPTPATKPTNGKSQTVIV